MSCVDLPFICLHLLRCLYRSFMMTKRDSHFAELPTPRTLRMEEHDIDMQTAGPHTPATPGPDFHPQASSSTAPNVHNHPLIPPLPLPTNTFQGQPRQRVVHSILFKVLERPLTIGGFSREVLVEETDLQGYTKSKSLGFSSMALLDTSVTEGETHWTMIDSALSSPIIGGIGLEHRRLVLCSKSTGCKETNLNRISM